MKKIILIAITVLLAVVLLGEIGFLIYKGTAAVPQETTGASVSTTEQTNQTTQTTAPSETQTAETESVPETTEGEYELPVVTIPQQTQGENPSGSTSGKPAENTQPTDTEPMDTEPKETRDDGLDENELPPMPI